MPLKCSVFTNPDQAFNVTVLIDFVTYRTAIYHRGSLSWWKRGIKTLKNTPT